MNTTRREASRLRETKASQGPTNSEEETQVATVLSSQSYVTPKEEQTPGEEIQLRA
jgi:hypothetical protein